MDNVYTVRQFRSSMKEVMDKVDNGVHIQIKRNGSVYTLKKEDIVQDFIKGLDKKVNEYGCGCKKGDGVTLCKKHGRH